MLVRMRVVFLENFSLQRIKFLLSCLDIAHLAIYGQIVSRLDVAMVVYVQDISVLITNVCVILLISIVRKNALDVLLLAR